MKHLSQLAACAVCFSIILTAVPAGAQTIQTAKNNSVVVKNSVAKSVVLQALEEELARNMRTFRERAKQPPYFISYNVTDASSTVIGATRGALETSDTTRARLFDADVRVGSYERDNTSEIRGDDNAVFGGGETTYTRPVSLPLEDDKDALKSAIWLETDKRFKAAIERLIKVEANKTVRVEAFDNSGDLSREPAAKAIIAHAPATFDKLAWEHRVKRLSKFFNDFPDILDSSVTFSLNDSIDYFANTEGTSVQHGAKLFRVSILAQTKAADGMDLYRFESFDAHTEKGLPSDEIITAAMRKMAVDLTALRRAPVIAPFTGPAILSGRASGVFFHEIFGHRMEGHRQKSEDEGQTFTSSVGQLVLPKFLSVYDDPTLESLNGTDLNGFYEYDDEGTRAQAVTVIEHGILRNFLMSRSPIANFPNSNGHGRKSAGFAAVGRQGNLIVESARGVSDAELRRMLIAECKRQGKPYGLLFDDISGGFTVTTRGTPQSFQVTPLMVYRVYVDGTKPDELVRGADLIGTPLTSFSRIIATGNRQEVFNGYCGAESGWIPVSAVSPSILVSQIEVQKQQKASDRLPVLPPPPAAAAASAEAK